MDPCTENQLTLSGRVEKIIYRHPERGYTVLQLHPSKSAAKIIVTGIFPAFERGQEICFQGHWSTHPQHGKQFSASHYQEKGLALPIEKFLTQYIDGVGPSTARKLMDAFGDALITVLNEKPERLKEIPGIRNQRYHNIVTSWRQQKASLEIMLFLTLHGVSFSNAAKIYKKYGHKTIEAVNQDPYRLCDIDGIGFQTADKFAIKLQFSLTDPRRLKSGFLYLLGDAAREGHCGVPREKLLTKATELLSVSSAALSTALDEAIQQKVFIADTVGGFPCLFSPLLWQQERNIALRLKKLMKTPLMMDKSNIQKQVQEVIGEENLPLTEEQHEAILQALAAKVFVLTGGPGVGKTTLIRLLIKVFSKQKINFALGAPTGRAAKRISESTGQNAKTLHRLLEYDPFSQTFGYHASFPLPYQVLILDECSMLDVPLFAAFMEAVSLHSRIIFVGDVDQLSAVGPGEVLKSLIASKEVPFFYLKTIFRQMATSQIIINAHRVNQGLMPHVEKHAGRDFYLIRAEEPTTQQQKIVKLVTEQLPHFGFGPDEIQVLAPMNGGLLGVDALNGLLQSKLNPNGSQSEIKHQDGVLRTGDKVLQIVNNYEKNVFNGDIGKVTSIHMAERKCKITFDKQPIEYRFKELDQLRLAYAITIHKSQGSEYPAAVVVLSMSQRIMLKRNLLYTAITRGKSCVVVVCEPQALHFAVKGEAVKRINKLEEWLRDD